MSHKAYVKLLAHDQPIGGRVTRLPYDVALEMVRRLVCEQIRQDLFRMLPPESACMVIKRCELTIASYMPEKLPPREVSGLIFRGPRPRTPHSIFFRRAVLAGPRSKERV